MKLFKILSFFLFIFLYSCAEFEKTKILKKNNKVYFSSTGFALIYDENLFKNKIINKKISNDGIFILHDIIKKNTPVRITNLTNSKYIDMKVKKGDYPKIFNVVISKEAASLLELDFENPYVEIRELKKNKTFVAKEGSIFEEEKQVEGKAPVDEITMNDLSAEKNTKKKKKFKKRNFILVISDFYYEDTAVELKNDLVEKSNLENISIKKINDTKYRLFAGPFKNFNALKTTYISLNNLGFESLNVYNE